MIFEYSSYRDFLKGALAQRIQKNPSYTMRAFALQLGVAPSMLTSVFQGRRNLSEARAYAIASKLGLQESESEYFVLLVQKETARSPEVRERLQSRIHAINPKQSAHSLTVDRFRMISQWYHLPMLEMTALKGGVSAPRAASSLGISRVEAEMALDRLERLELVERDERGSYRKVHDALLVSSSLPNEGLQQFYAQMLQKGVEALSTQGVEERYTGSLTIAFDPEQLPEAKRLINECLARVEELAVKGHKRTQIYHLVANFFDLTYSKTIAASPSHDKGKEKRV